ncbi:MAG TPA: glycosyltransferase family 2 protein [Rhizobacter sp.]|nr:glycosyltransferase family 2 protein [Rhizobacter sp.]
MRPPGRPKGEYRSAQHEGVPVTLRRKLSVVIISKNEAERIEACLRSVAWADEIVVVDADSSDATRDIARRFTPQVHDLPWRGFGPQKQAAVELALHDWILSVDCDERVTPELADEIQAILCSDAPNDAYTVPRRTFLGAKEIRHSGWSPDRSLRLFKRSAARFSDSLVHERVVTSSPVGRCRNYLLHYSFAGLAPLLFKLNQYTDLSARMMFANGRSCSIFDLTLRPLAAFIKAYVLKAGFLDGFNGVVVSVSTAVNVFYKYAKLRELSEERARLNQSGSSFW